MHPSVTVTRLRLCRFMNPMGGRPGFALPIFCDNDEQLFRQVLTGGKISAFVPVELELSSTDAVANPLTGEVGGDEVVALALGGGQYVFGYAANVAEILRRRLKNSKFNPFLRLEIGEFIGDFATIAEALADIERARDRIHPASSALPKGLIIEEEEAPPAAIDTRGAVQIQILAQYVRDLSFENPAAPMSLQGPEPALEVGVDVQARDIGIDQYEVSIRIRAEAKAVTQTIFVCEVVYAGVFVLKNIAQENVHPVLLIECPRQLFPFARRVVADTTRDGGFPPLMIDPVDFVQLYNQRRSRQKERSEFALNR